MGDQSRQVLVPCRPILPEFFLPGGDPGGYFSFGERPAHLTLVPQAPEP